MAKVKQAGSRKSKNTFGNSRQPGPIGRDTATLPFPPRSAGELLLGKFPSLNDPEWIKLDRPKNVYVWIQDSNTPPDPRPIRLDASIVQKADPDARGETESKLYVLISKNELEPDRFGVAISEVLVKSGISVNPKADFKKLSVFAPLYEEFYSGFLAAKNRKSALRSFADKHTKVLTHTNPGGVTRTVGATPDFTGVRAATVQHEVNHIRHAQQQAETGIEVLNKILAKEGRNKNAQGLRERIINSADISFMGWNSDPEHKFHREIVAFQIHFMIALFELHQRTLEQAKAAGNPHPRAELDRLNDVLVILLMEKLGEPYPWTDQA